MAIWSAKEAAAKSVGTGLEGRPRDWDCHLISIDRRGGHPTRAHVIHGDTRYEITLYFDGPDAVLALCLESDRSSVNPTPMEQIATAPA